jgi:hypothetical protein
VPFLTHFADLSSWEYAQKLVKLIPQYQAAGAQVVAVGLGSATNARRFAEVLGFPLDLLYADPEGWAYKALGFEPGARRQLAHGSRRAAGARQLAHAAAWRASPPALASLPRCRAVLAHGA